MIDLLEACKLLGALLSCLGRLWGPAELMLMLHLRRGLLQLRNLLLHRLQMLREALDDFHVLPLLCVLRLLCLLPVLRLLLSLLPFLLRLLCVLRRLRCLR